MKIVAVNKSAGFEYFIEDKFEAGIVPEKQLQSERQLLFRAERGSYPEKYAHCGL